MERERVTGIRWKWDDGQRESGERKTDKENGEREIGAERRWRGREGRKGKRGRRAQNVREDIKGEVTAEAKKKGMRTVGMGEG